jgi:hypothetical protein
MRIKGNGLVGIGRNPTVALDVVGDITATGTVTAGSVSTSTLNIAGAVRARGGSPGTPGGAGFAFSGNGGDPDSGMFCSADGQLEIFTNNVERIRVVGNNVGIGTAFPSDRLHINGGGITAGLKLDDGTTRHIRMYRSTNGCILFGNFMPQAGNGNSQIQWDGDGNWDQSSDRTLKKEITDAEPVLERLMQLPVRRYRWKDRAPDARKSFGVIAQEVKPLFPDVVGAMVLQGETKETMTVKYGAFGLIAAKAVQELKKEKDAEVKALQEENASLRERLTALEAKDKARDAKLAAIEKLLQSSGPPAARAVAIKSGR